MKKLFFSVAVVSLLVGCSSSNSEVTADPKGETTNQESTQIADVVNPNRLLTVEVDGMVCEMGCGGTIRKVLKATNGVANCSFDYEEGRETNVAKIEFDKDVISADEISKIISEANEGQFTIGDADAVMLEELIDSSSEVDDSKGDVLDQPSPINMSSSSAGTGFEMPNILDFFSSLLTR